jgi:hypothetical protein
MPIVYWIDHERRLVMAQGHGIFTREDILGYQHAIRSRPELATYNELMDMSAVEYIALASTERIRELAWRSAGMDVHAQPLRFAIVAPNDLAFGLGRMYEAYRSLDDRSTKQVGVFRSLADAFAFLGINST